MPKIVFLPNQKYCPIGAVLEANIGETILEIALRNGIALEHACESSCSCATCHCIIRQGFHSLEKMSDLEADMLDKAWGLEQESRLSCQAKVLTHDLVVEIPRYTVHYSRED